MSGLILLAVVIPLVWGLVWLARSIASKAEKPLTRAAIKWSVLLVLLTLPFIDEIIGKFQFEALCRANGIESADVSRARGKKVKLEIGSAGSSRGRSCQSKSRTGHTEIQTPAKS
jgi:hypothetical protein